MKRFILNFVKTNLLLAATAFTLMSCEKKPTPKVDDPTVTPPVVETKFVVSYKDVILGNQNNNTIGQFFKTQNGEVVSIENAFLQQGYMSMVFFTEYGNNRIFLTFPANAYSESFSKEDETNNLFDRPSVGINYWQASNLNSGEVKLAGTMDKDMKKNEFDALASSLNWKEFDTKFKEYNSGDGDLSFTAKSITPDVGSVYMVQLNNTIRAFIYIKNLSPGGASGGTLKFDIVIEGGGDYSNDPSTRRVAPSKD